MIKLIIFLFLTIIPKFPCLILGSIFIYNSTFLLASNNSSFVTIFKAFSIDYIDSFSSNSVNYG